MLLFIVAPLSLIAQEMGIRFEQGLSWQLVKAKAKAENKYIFVDCYATWCGPCKRMENEVYTKESVGNYLNGKFISIKIQMDTTNKDDEFVQKWYNDAHFIKSTYEITAYPTLLFFSPEGKIVHKYLGYSEAEDFIMLTANALNPDKQYYTLLEKYKQGRKNYAEMVSLAKIGKAVGEKNMAVIIAQDYMNNYLVKLEKKDLYSRENIEFIASFIQSSKEKWFNLFYHNPTQVDKVMNKSGFSQGVVDYIIAKEDIDPKLWKYGNPITNRPDWGKITSTISKKYNVEYAERTVLNAKLRWYDYKKDWPEVIKYNIKKIEKYGLDTAGWGKAFLNNTIYYTIFMHSNNKVDINKGIKWMEIIINARPNNPQYLDTYANLLYKVGRVQEAIVWEQKAATISPRDEEIQNNLDKMKRNEPTWSVPASDETK